jgi:hypothetical protein
LNNLFAYKEIAYKCAVTWGNGTSIAAFHKRTGLKKYGMIPYIAGIYLILAFDIVIAALLIKIAFGNYLIAFYFLIRQPHN